MRPSLFDHIIRQFIRVLGRLRKIAGQLGADFVNGVYQRNTEVLAVKMRSHFFHNAFPESIATFFVNALVTNNRKFVNTWCDKNQHRIALARLVHTEPLKPPLRRNERIALQFAALD